MGVTRMLLFHLKSSRRTKCVGICRKNISAEIQLGPYRNYRILHVQYERLWQGGGPSTDLGQAALRDGLLILLFPSPASPCWSAVPSPAAKACRLMPAAYWVSFA